MKRIGLKYIGFILLVLSCFTSVAQSNKQIVGTRRDTVFIANALELDSGKLNLKRLPTGLNTDSLLVITPTGIVRKIVQPNFSASLSGGGVSPRVAFWTAATVLSSSVQFQYDANNNFLTGALTTSMSGNVSSNIINGSTNSLTGGSQISFNQFRGNSNTINANASGAGVFSSSLFGNSNSIVAITTATPVVGDLLMGTGNILQNCNACALIGLNNANSKLTTSNSSAAIGHNLIIKSFDAQTWVGKFNDTSRTSILFGVGRGAVGGRLNAFWVDSLGNAFLFGGTTATRPALPAFGMFRANTDSVGFEFYTGTKWLKFGTGSGVATTIDTTSLSNRINLKLTASDTTSMLSFYARKFSPAFTGVATFAGITVPTRGVLDSTINAANTLYVDRAVANLRNKQDTTHLGYFGSSGDSLLIGVVTDSLYSPFIRDSLDLHIVKNPDKSLTFYTQANIVQTVVTGAVNYTILPGDDVVIFTGSTTTWTFPATTTGRMIYLTNQGTGSITLGTAVRTANATTTTTIAAGTNFIVDWDGTQWRKIN